MPATRRRTGNSEICPVCSRGHLIDGPRANSFICPLCGRSFDRKSLHRSMPRDTTQIYRLKKLHHEAQVSQAAEKNLAFAFSELDRQSAPIGIPREVKESASTIYRRAVSRNLMRGRPLETIVAASLYAACRMNGLPHTIDEMADNASISRKELGRNYRLISKTLNLNQPAAKPQGHVEKLCRELGLSKQTLARGVQILDAAEKTGAFSGLGPRGVAAAAVYISAIQCKEPRSQSEIATAAGITRITLRRRYKDLETKLGVGSIDD